MNAPSAPAAPSRTPSKPATDATRARQQALRARLPLQDRQAFEDAHRGLVETAKDLQVMGANGRTVWTLRGFEFLEKEDAPDSVHPGLWRQARLNMFSGLFKVCERMYQLRGMDLANMTIIEGDTGLIVIDPLTYVERAQAAMALYYRHRPHKPVVAVIYTHSHVDHFGGVRGVIDEADVLAGNVQVIAPAGFMEEAVSENLIAGPAMGRRALYQFGNLLPRGELGTVDAGLGKSSMAGSLSLIAPTRLITEAVETLVIDGIETDFILTPGTEAPAEMMMFHPQLRVLNTAEVVTQCMHNLLPMRGAQVRDPLAWSRYINETLHRHGDRAEILIAQHHWPMWGGERVREMLRKHRDLYKFLHDQTLRLINRGYVGSEIAEMIELPESLAEDWSTHAFYGHLPHNVRAIYQRYLGYYEGNPAQLEALPPAAAARKTIAYMGGAEAVLARARADFDQGEYRWVAQVGSQLVFADPANRAARELAADALEQLGYQSESATARNAFLQGAAELRDGVPRIPGGGGTGYSRDLVRALPAGLFFDWLGVQVDGLRAAGQRIVLHWRLTGVTGPAGEGAEDWTLNPENGALTHHSGHLATADARLTLARPVLDDIALGKTSLAEAVDAGRVQVQGDASRVQALFGLMDKPGGMFPMVEPRPGT